VTKKKAANKAERDHILKVKMLGCVARGCGKHGPSDAHHIVMGGRRLGHMFVLPLCVEHHRGGIPGVSMNNTGLRVWEERFGKQLDLHKLVEEQLRLQA
jgi:hypothetical protein